MTPEQQEKARVVSEWLGFRVTPDSCNATSQHQFFTWHCPACTCAAETPDSLCSCLDLCSAEIPDFLTDESASALILERLNDSKRRHHVTLQSDWHNNWSVVLYQTNKFVLRTKWHPDRRTAIFEAGYQEAMRVRSK